jgi:D-xylose transport system substrate-binding protein
MKRSFTRMSLAAVLALSLLGVASCGDDDDSTSSGAKTTTSRGGGTAVAGISATSFTPDFKVMEKLKDLAASGKGSIAVLLPDTASSARYVAFDAPYLTKAFQTAGLSSSDFKVSNAQGSASTQQSQAEAAITEGASVILLDQLDSGSAAAIQKNAEAHGVQIIDYDRLTKGGIEGRYYVSFDNTNVGKLIGQGMVDCISAWNVQKPQLLLMDGDPTDNNATLFANGYKSVLQPKVSSGDYTLVAEPGGTWDQSKGQTLFEQQFTAHPNINAVVAANDNLGQAVISVLKSRSVPAKKVPVTGQDATSGGLQNVLAGYQCGSVYKPIYLEAQAAAALALYLRAGQKPPRALVNGTTQDPVANKDVPSVLLAPTWVTTQNMNNTVIRDDFVKASDICTPELMSACTAAGISA